MNEWKKYEDEMPPLGKILVSHSPELSHGEQFAVITFGYMVARLDSNYYPKPSTEEDIKSNKGYWLELPEVPKE